MKYEHIARVLDWCKVHILLAEKKSEIYFKEGEVWWCGIGINIGHEEFGKGTTLMLNQVRIFYRNRLQRRIVVMTKEDLKVIMEKFRELYCPIKFITPPLAGETGIGGKSQIVP